MEGLGAQVDDRFEPWLVDRIGATQVPSRRVVEGDPRCASEVRDLRRCLGVAVATGKEQCGEPDRERAEEQVAR